MTTTAEATSVILAAMPTFATETCPAESSVGRILRQTVVAERDQPPFDRVMMDGIAIAHADIKRGLRRFPIQATQAAGDERLTLEPGNAIEIMTGASLPEGADCIVPVERIAVTDGAAELEAGYEATERQFVHARGSDHGQGEKLLAPGSRISPMDVAVIASADLTVVEVSQRPSVHVLSTGNELVPAGKPIAPDQVRLSNGPAVVAMLQQYGYSRYAHDHLVDDPDLLERRIAAHLAEADVLILSGGVSMGKADFVPQVLDTLGVRVVFHKISQRPGRPMWFGRGPEGQAVFALPGNPVSTLVCCRQYVIPALAKAGGLIEPAPEFASLTTDVTFEPKLTCFQPVKLLSNTGGSVLAMPVQPNTSGDFTSLSQTDGFVELPLEETRFSAGTAVRLHRWRSVGY